MPKATGNPTAVTLSNIRQDPSNQTHLDARIPWYRVEERIGHLVTEHYVQCANRMFFKFEARQGSDISYSTNVQMKIYSLANYIL